MGLFTPSFEMLKESQNPKGRQQKNEEKQCTVIYKRKRSPQTGSSTHGTALLNLGSHCCVSSGIQQSDMSHPQVVLGL